MIPGEKAHPGTALLDKALLVLTVSVYFINSKILVPCVRHEFTLNRRSTRGKRRSPKNH